VGEPSPGLAALLGFIPGVGAMYNGQYAKGFVHLTVFAALVLLTDENWIFGLFIAGWILYMVIEAHHTACARRDGTPLPNPFGLNDLAERLGFGKAWPSSVPPHPTPADSAQAPVRPTPPADGGTVCSAPDAYFHQAADGSQTYSAPGAYFHQAPDGSQTYGVPGVPPVNPYMPPYSYPYAPPDPPLPPVPPCADVQVPYYRRFPPAAVWLIVFGVIFLIGDNGFFRIFHHPVFWPVLLIGGGVWLFVHKMITTGHGLENDGSAFYQWRFACAVRYSIWVILTGVLWLLDVLGILSWGRSWPLFVIAAGVMLLFKRTRFGGSCAYPYGATPGQPGSSPPETPVPGSEDVPSEPSHSTTGSDSGNGLHDDREGR
jgi:hypothetical protein